jgi:hypothetical protein
MTSFPKQSRRRILVLVLGQKGGVGKSALAELVIATVRAGGHIVAAFDADAAVSSLYQKLAIRDANGVFLPQQDPTKGVVRYNARDEHEVSLLVNWLESPASRAVHDMPGGSRDEIAKLLGAGADGSLGELLDFLDSMECSLVVLHPVTGDAANITSQLNTLNAFGDRAHHVAVVNKAFQSSESDIWPWRSSKTRKRLLEQGGREIEMPALNADIFQKLKAGHHPLMSDGTAANLTLLDRQRLKIFQRDFQRELSKIEDWLI